MDCAICRGPNGQEFRDKWGCDRELPAAQVGDDLDLRACGLAGREHLRRCPNVTMPRGIGAVLSSYSGFMRGVLVDPGGLGDQSAWLVDAWDCLAVIVERAKEKPSD